MTNTDAKIMREAAGYDRPSTHGQALGKVLAQMAELGGGAETCSTCAFREGALANESAGTGLTAMHCAIGTDPSPFGCHHGMKDGQPSKLCAGYLAAMRAPLSAWTDALQKVAGLPCDENAPDKVRQSYDAWRLEVDPDHQMDVYQLGRAYARRNRDTTS